MNILFLTNNEITRPLYQWLCETEGDSVIHWEGPVGCADLERWQIDVIVSYNYRHIITADVVERYRQRIINLHISLLPWNRGASPNLFSFLEDTPAGVSIHEINEGLDKGDILCQQRIFFDYDKETLASSYQTSHEAIQALFRENWSNLRVGNITPRPQEGRGSYHRYSDMERYRPILNYNDSIRVFLEKAKEMNRHDEH